MHTIARNNGQRNGAGQNPELISATHHRFIDAAAARKLLTGTARLLEYAAASSDGRELLAGLDLLRRAPSMLPRLEVR